MPSNLYANVNYSDNGVIDKEPPDDIDKDNKDYDGINNQDLTIVYNEVIGSSKEVLLLDTLGRDENT